MVAVSRETITLPLFLTDAVLFPGTRLELSLHDERHRRIIQECVEHDTPLGVVLGRRDDEGLPAPAAVATVARVLEHRPTEPTGTVALVVAGVSRFALLSYRQGTRVLLGQGRFLPDLDEQPARALVDECYALASEYVADDPAAAKGVPVDPEALSYWVANLLPWDLEVRQEVLEQRSLPQRLASEVGELRTLIDAARTPRAR
jgi:Lon protease-like protein